MGGGKNDERIHRKGGKKGVKEVRKEEQRKKQKKEGRMEGRKEGRKGVCEEEKRIKGITEYKD